MCDESRSLVANFQVSAPNKVEKELINFRWACHSQFDAYFNWVGKPTCLLIPSSCVKE